VDNASCVGSGYSLLLLEKGYGLMDASGGNAGSWIAWVEGGRGDREGVDVMAGFGYEGYWMGVLPLT